MKSNDTLLSVWAATGSDDTTISLSSRISHIAPGSGNPMSSVVAVDCRTARCNRTHQPNQDDLETLDRFVRSVNPETGRPWIVENSADGSAVRELIEQRRTAIYGGQRLDPAVVREAEAALTEAQAEHQRRVAEKDAKDLAEFRARRRGV